MFDFNENNIANLIAKNQRVICTSYDCLVPKCYTSHDNECDVFAIRKSGLSDEFEIKISKSDLLNDAKKKVSTRHQHGFGEEFFEIDKQHENKINVLGYEKWKKILAPWEKMKYQALVDGDTPVNYFWYVIKHDIADSCDLPEWAGLIKVFDGGKIRVVRNPKKLHKKKLDDKFKFQIVRKLGFRYWDSRLKDAGL